ncbi:hypothetical protein RchiOBHm_Chr1g0374731 [Rosa chinensis]|uniref:Uncharacterized protein n=1 Tax=Rosa chinensis TaxID=74649 RepID=A0A2P6SMG6_ROSCH|nr:hypothetical protein RchiOBHm_Chr1g0374731 [Rosa chinensis]
MPSSSPPPHSSPVTSTTRSPLPATSPPQPHYSPTPTTIDGSQSQYKRISESLYCIFHQSEHQQDSPLVLQVLSTVAKLSA